MVQEREVRRITEKHLDEVGRLNVATEIIIGTKPGEPAQAFYVAKKDFSEERTVNPNYRELLRAGSRFENALWQAGLRVFVSSVNPSQLDDFLADCSRKGWEIARLPIPQPQMS